MMEKLLRIIGNLISRIVKEKIMENISGYPIASLDDLPLDLRDKIMLVQEKTGFIPNIFLALGYRPNQLRAFIEYHEAIIDEKSTLDNIEREMIIVATSGANKCTYCVVAHGGILRIYSKQTLLSDQIAIDYSKSNISEKHKLMLDFACKLSRTPELINVKDHQILYDAGFTKDKIWDIGAVTSFFALSNRMAHLLNVRPNEDFYGMGRKIR